MFFIVWKRTEQTFVKFPLYAIRLACNLTDPHNNCVCVWHTGYVCVCVSFGMWMWRGMCVFEWRVCLVFYIHMICVCGIHVVCVNFISYVWCVQVMCMCAYCCMVRSGQLTLFTSDKVQIQSRFVHDFYNFMLPPPQIVWMVQWLCGSPSKIWSPL